MARQKKEKKGEGLSNPLPLSWRSTVKDNTTGYGQLLPVIAPVELKNVHTLVPQF